MGKYGNRLGEKNSWWQRPCFYDKSPKTTSGCWVPRAVFWLTRPTDLIRSQNNSPCIFLFFPAKWMRFYWRRCRLSVLLGHCLWVGTSMCYSWGLNPRCEAHVGVDGPGWVRRHLLTTSDRPTPKGPSTHTGPTETWQVEEVSTKTQRSQPRGVSSFKTFNTSMNLLKSRVSTSGKHSIRICVFPANKSHWEAVSLLWNKSNVVSYCLLGLRLRQWKRVRKG